MWGAVVIPKPFETISDADLEQLVATAMLA